MSGGKFYRDAESGAIRCRYDNGTIIVSHKGAKHCTTHPAKLQLSGRDPAYQGSADVATR